MEHLQIHSWDKKTRIKIGKYCSIADEVHIFLGGNHDVSRVSTYPFGSDDTLIGPRNGHPLSNGDIIIGNDVWIGSNVTITRNTEIGDGSVVGAGSVVTRNVGALTVTAGVPARVIRHRS